VGRLLDIAQIHMEVGDYGAAQSAIKQAKSLDAGSEHVQESECKLAIVSGAINQAKEIFAELESSTRIISYMNSRAVVLSRTGAFEEGIKCYNDTIAALPKKMAYESEAVRYNLALAHARYGDLPESLKILQDLQNSKSKIGP